MEYAQSCGHSTDMVDGGSQYTPIFQRFEAYRGENLDIPT